jgi:endonuclease/exonuclease/phosphatase family metal-dependent hydrolase
MLSNPGNDLPTLPYRGRANLLQEIAQRLPDFAMEFAPMQDDFDITPVYPKQLQLGVAIFYRKYIPVTKTGSFFIYNDYNTYQPKDYETEGHNAVFLNIDGSTPLTIVTLHGNSQPAHKRDSEKRLQQSQTILDFLAQQPGEKIVMGDFNLFPDTESIRMFEQARFRNLVVEHNIPTTRGSMMRALFPEYEHGTYGFQEFADYTFISSGINVQSFSVPDLPLSDHLPMILECTIK